ncbi:MAG TPA: winged helix DNA-binding protein [Candidatus Gallacutalibacter pullicola]|mgnify:FL=1|uniref:Winged helix DNA-binding protein n=1 Tax=Candidatus Gallacutalibacter pullicola TaxID=2840830 RepID=A0A9D1DSD4_9FIRM|nr:winged helix DNA-binding protein [Candidatus Gallacutalibacter pullicola]
MDIHQETEELIEITTKLGKARPWLPRIEGVPSGEVVMLHHIKGLQDDMATAGQGVKISALSGRAGMSMPAVSQMMRSMEGKGLVERRMAHADRRVVYVSLTEKGEKIEAETSQYMTQILESVVKEFGEENTRQLILLFRKLHGVLQTLHLNGTD